MENMHVALFTGTRDLAGSRHGAVGRSELDLEYEPSVPSRRALGEGFFDDGEETVFDIRGQRTSRPRRFLGDEFANEVASTSSRLKARLQIASESADDAFAETSRGARAALDEAEASFRRRPRFTLNEPELDEPKPSLTKWTKLSSAADAIAEDLTSAAASRAKISKARLTDLEQEMEEMAEKQARREKRAAALRALVNETTSAADESLQSATKISSQSVHRSEKTEKHVSF